MTDNDDADNPPFGYNVFAMAIARRVLFVNPNRYHDPPVIPLGLEYLIDAVISKSITADLLDLCFSANPLEDIDRKVDSFSPDALCVTVRNIDSALYLNSQFFLPEIKSYIERLRTLSDSPIIIGGAGLRVDGAAVLRYLGADCAVVGPAEEVLPELLKDPGNLRDCGKVVRGTLPDSRCPGPPVAADYSTYVMQGGIPGFETHKGCTSSCSYCIEAGSSVTFKKPSDIVCELRHLVAAGYDHLHLCDSEFNEDLDHCLSVLQAIDRERLRFRWALYMRPGTCNRQLFRLLNKTGAYLVTLSVDTLNNCPEYWEAVEKMVNNAGANGIRVAVDFLAGFPYETEDTLKEALEFFFRIDPAEVVVNTHIRIYPSTKMQGIIERDSSLQQHLLGAVKYNESRLSPVFYNHVQVESLRELIKGAPLFRIAGEAPGVNYQRLSGGA